MATTWNPADKTAGLTLSNGNMTVVSGDSSTNFVRSTAGNTTGKVYVEMTWTQVFANAGVGIARSDAAVSPSFTGGAGVKLDGFMFVNGSTVGSGLGTPAVAGVTCCSIDLVNNRIWFRLNSGIWNNSAPANPATNVGGFDISTVVTGVAMMTAFSSSSPNNGVTANFGATAFAQTMPSGFAAWGVPVLPLPPPGTTGYGGYGGEAQARDLRDYAQRLRARATASKRKQKEQEI